MALLQTVVSLCRVKMERSGIVIKTKKAVVIVVVVKVAFVSTSTQGRANEGGGLRSKKI